jgi:hypothetical protein
MDIIAVLIEKLSLQAEPTTAAQLIKLLPERLKLKQKALSAALDDLANAGRILALAQGKGTAYCVRPALDLCTEALLARLRAIATASSPAQLKAGLTKSLHPWFDEALARLIVKGQAWQVSIDKQPYVQAEAPRPSQTLGPKSLQAAQDLLENANRRRRNPRSLADLCDWLDHDPVEEEAAAIAIPSGAQLILWHQQERGHTGSAMIAIPLTYERYVTWARSHALRADEEAFRGALKDLYDDGQALLEPCERPQDLPDLERRLQVPLTFGPAGYFWSPI